MRRTLPPRGRLATDDDGVVFSKAWTSLKAKEPGKIARRRSTEERPVGQPQHRAMVFRWDTACGEFRANALADQAHRASSSHR